MRDVACVTWPAVGAPHAGAQARAEAGGVPAQAVRHPHGPHPGAPEGVERAGAAEGRRAGAAEGPRAGAAPSAGGAGLESAFVVLVARSNASWSGVGGVSAIAVCASNSCASFLLCRAQRDSGCASARLLVPHSVRYAWRPMQLWPCSVHASRRACSESEDKTLGEGCGVRESSSRSKLDL